MTTDEEREQEKARYIERGHRRRNMWHGIYQSIDWLKNQESQEYEEIEQKLSKLVDKNVEKYG